MATNMKAVKQRIKSVQSTMQITKAMELVASSKLRKAKDRADTCRPYFHSLYETLEKISMENTDNASKYVSGIDNKKICYCVIAGDRGLAGGYNSNVFKRLEKASAGKEFAVLPIGKKAVEYCRKKGIEILSEKYAEVADIGVGDCFTIANSLCRMYRDGEFGHVELCYTNFVTMLTQQTSVFPILPLRELADPDKERPVVKELMIYEPDSITVFDAIVPEYMAGFIYGAVCESIASELASRRNAMDAASKNAGEMIGKLNLYYNRARQANITQEITEIIAGSEGI